MERIDGEWDLKELGGIKLIRPWWDLPPNKLLGRRFTLGVNYSLQDDCAFCGGPIWNEHGVMWKCGKCLEHHTFHVDEPVFSAIGEKL